MGKYKSMGAAIREALQIALVLQDQCLGGFTELVLRNKSGIERTVVIPSMSRIKLARSANYTGEI
jgi:hypothetical protein